MLPESLRDFSEQYPDDPEAGMRAALAFVVSTASVPAKHLAAEVGESPSEFSRMTATIPSEDANHRRTIPLGKLVKTMKFTGNLSPLHTLLGYLGYNPDELDKIRRPIKTREQLDEELLAEVKDTKATLKRVEERLVLRSEAAGGRRKK